VRYNIHKVRRCYTVEKLYWSWRDMINRGRLSFLVGSICLLFLVVLLTGCITITKNDGASGSPSPAINEDIVITLERTPCFGQCPVYSLKIKGDGTVIYSGVQFVKITGIQETTISMDAVDQLLMEFEKADYFSLNDSYIKFGKSDMPSANTSITLGGLTKAINHYLGDLTAPKSLTELENKIDEIVNSDQWIK
jgi:hypothetical protein